MYKKKVIIKQEEDVAEIVGDEYTDEVTARIAISDTVNEVDDAVTTIENLSNLEEETIAKVEEAEEKLRDDKIDSLDVVDMECFKQKMELIMGVKLSGPTIALEDARNNPKEQFVLCTEGIKDALKSIWEFIKKIFKWIGDKIKQFINWIKSLFSKNKAEKKKEAIQEVSNTIKRQQISDDIDNFFNDLFTDTSKKFEEISKTIKESTDARVKAGEEFNKELGKLADVFKTYNERVKADKDLEKSAANLLNKPFDLNTEAIDPRLYNGDNPSHILIRLIYKADKEIRKALNSLKTYNNLFIVNLKDYTKNLLKADTDFYKTAINIITKILDTKGASTEDEVIKLLDELETEVTKHKIYCGGIWHNRVEDFTKSVLAEPQFEKYGLKINTNDKMVAFPTNLRLIITDDTHAELEVSLIVLNKEGEEVTVHTIAPRREYDLSKVTNERIEQVLKEEADDDNDVNDVIKSMEEIEKMMSEYNKKAHEPLKNQLDKLEKTDPKLCERIYSKLNSVFLSKQVKYGVKDSVTAMKAFFQHENTKHKVDQAFIGDIVWLIKYLQMRKYKD